MKKRVKLGVYLVIRELGCGLRHCNILSNMVSKAGPAKGYKRSNFIFHLFQ
jgi:hypothetical protein